MDDKERLNLKKMLKEYDTEETTDKIRELKNKKRYGNICTLASHIRQVVQNEL